jgi:hypothetical protein
MSIEEKLEALKVINARKDEVDMQLAMISRAENEPPIESFIRWQSANGTNQIPMDGDLAKQCLSQLQQTLGITRAQLIDKAKELMK